MKLFFLKAKIFFSVNLPMDLLEVPPGAVTPVMDAIPDERKPNILDLFRPKMILLRSLNMCLQWVSVTMVYYGLLFASTSLNGDPYINFALVVSAELPTYPLYFFLPRIFGRKYILIANQLIAAICCVLGGLLITEPRYFLKLCFKSRLTYEFFFFTFHSVAGLQIALVMFGRLCASLGFAMVYLYTSELFPTPIRSTAVGVCSTVARIGGIIALLMEGLGSVWKPLPMVIFGAVAFIATILGTQCGKRRNYLSHFFDKNFVKATVLLELI